ncbi:hypothetical protein [Massilia eurypsychrophila]|uniref:hypothetical protein n=1 Tax=Massilia eurypsychrophila TaxID=1485217 RepID=UPI001033BBB2|nr:hypothetical protein [Massilia eurypsychrophila]
MEAIEFVRRIVAAGGDEEAAWLVHAELAGWINVAGFSPYPEDKLDWVYGIAEEELDEDLILEMLRKLKIKLPTSEALLALGPINTPIEIAHLVRRARTDMCPTKG